MLWLFDFDESIVRHLERFIVWFQDQTHVVKHQVYAASWGTWLVLEAVRSSRSATWVRIPVYVLLAGAFLAVAVVLTRLRAEQAAANRTGLVVLNPERYRTFWPNLRLTLWCLIVVRCATLPWGFGDQFLFSFLALWCLYLTSMHTFPVVGPPAWERVRAKVRAWAVVVRGPAGVRTLRKEA